MAGKSLSELDLNDEQMPAVNADDLPEFGGWQPPPQPGPFRFQLPPSMEKVWDKTDKGILVAKFDKDNPLVIHWSPTGQHVGETFTTRLSIERRARGAVTASDLDYLLKALLPRGAALPTSAKAFVETLNQYGGQIFAADVSYNWSCGVNRDRYIPDPANPGETVKEEGVKGCGARYYQAEKTKKEGAGIAKVNGEYPYEIQCRCGAVVRAFAGLDNIRKP